jgi:hypothetical protein
MPDMDVLYLVNDDLTALARQLHVRFASNDEEDDILNELTHEVARKFGLEPDEARASEPVTGEPDYGLRTAAPESQFRSDLRTLGI